MSALSVRYFNKGAIGLYKSASFTFTFLDRRGYWLADIEWITVYNLARKFLPHRL